MYHCKTHCRACGFAKSGAQGIKSAQGANLIEVCDLGIQPLANDFRKSGEPCAGYAPLKVLLCPKCSLAQLSVVVDPKILYAHYSYVTSPSDMMRTHFGKLIGDIEAEANIRTVLEIGSNDGKLLKMLQERSYSVSGIDPAENLAKIARESGVPTRDGFFCKETARFIPVSDIVIARHVFCHVDDWKNFVSGLEEVSSPATLVCIEVPYVGDMLKNVEFDTIYHEHLSYLSIKAMDALLKDSQFHIHKIIRYPIHGGAILIMLRRNDSGIEPSEDTHIKSDNFTVDDWKAFSVEAHAQIDRLRATVQTLTAQGKRVAGLGASAKSTVWINACKFTRKDVSFISDNTPQKQWTFSPGSDIPIMDEGAILRDLPDYVIMWAWNYKAEILEKFALARSKGVKFIVPVPKIEII